MYSSVNGKTCILKSGMEGAQTYSTAFYLIAHQHDYIHCDQIKSMITNNSKVVFHFAVPLNFTSISVSFSSLFRFSLWLYRTYHFYISQILLRFQFPPFVLYMLLLVLLIAGVCWSYNRQHGYVLTVTIPTQYPLLSNNEHFLVVFLETS